METADAKEGFGDVNVDVGPADHAEVARLAEFMKFLQAELDSTTKAQEIWSLEVRTPVLEENVSLKLTAECRNLRSTSFE